MRVTELALLIVVLVAPGQAAPSEPGPPALDAAPSELAEKLAQGDRASDAGDRRGALFAYQDAVYLAPSSAAARVKLGRAYLALRHPAQAQAQAEQALAIDAGSAEARRLLDDARAGRVPPDPAEVAPPAPAPAIAAAAFPTAESALRPQAQVYRLTPAAAPIVAVAATPVARVAAAPAAPVVQADPAPAAPAPQIVQAAVAAPPAERTATERYRAGVQHVVNREFTRAIVELDGAIRQDQRFGAAYAARASARYGLGFHREAAQDYASAIELDPGLGTPLYGLAECYRKAGDPRAAELYRRYADSRAPDIREDLRTLAVRRAAELAHQKAASELSHR